MSENNHRHGGDQVGELLARRGVTHLFTLCGGHISPILVGAKSHGVTVVDAPPGRLAGRLVDAYLSSR